MPRPAACRFHVPGALLSSAPHLHPPCSKGTLDSAHGVLTLRMESGDDTVAGDFFQDAVLIAAGREPYALIDAAVTAAAALSGGARPLREKRLPPNLDVFGWCSWDRWGVQGRGSGMPETAAGSHLVPAVVTSSVLIPCEAARSPSPFISPTRPSGLQTPCLSQLLLCRQCHRPVGSGAEPEQRWWVPWPACWGVGCV